MFANMKGGKMDTVRAGVGEGARLRPVAARHGHLGKQIQAVVGVTGGQVGPARWVGLGHQGEVAVPYRPRNYSKLTALQHHHLCVLIGFSGRALIVHLFRDITVFDQCTGQGFTESNKSEDPSVLVACACLL